MTTANAYSPTIEQPERMSLTSLETITDTLLELMKACMHYVQYTKKVLGQTKMTPLFFNILFELNFIKIVILVIS